MLTTSEKHLLFSSNPVMGAYNISPKGSRFSVNFNPPLSFDQKTQQLRLELLEAELYYNTPNITVGNNHIMIVGPLQDGKNIMFDFYLTPGLYELETLNSELNNQLILLGGKTNIIKLTPNITNTKVVMVLQYQTTFMQLDIKDGIADIIGFEKITYPTGTYTGTLNPEFNAINYYTISANMISSGISFNGQNKQVIGRILIDVDPSEQILSMPIHPYSVDITNLLNQTIPSAEFWLSDDKGNDVDTMGEYFSFRLRIVSEL